jgi:hypothetical protein
MSRKQLMTIAVAIAIMADPALAELQGASKSAPTFTNEELAIITRNVALSEIVKNDPWVVRKLLDAIDPGHPPVSTQAIEAPLAPEPPPDSFDPNENPDVARLQRVSPEAVHDLFQLLKQAAQKDNAKPK